MIRSYTDLRRISLFEDRFRYLALRGVVGESTFGFDRYINQQFYRSRQWRRLREDVIVRDNGCDMGVDGYEIFNKIVIHHMNPMTVNDVAHGVGDILDPEFLVCVTLKTHNAIHYGDENQLPKKYIDRTSGDTALWKRS